MPTVKIESIFGGRSTTEYFSSKGAGQFLSSLGIDPEMPKDDSSLRPSGLIRPTSLSKFSGSAVNATPLFFVVNPKDSNVYVYLSSGKFISYSSSLSSETAISTLSSSGGNGMEYYDNYIYLAVNGDVSRYGPLDGSPSLTNTYWSSTLSLAALSNTTYPSINGVAMPNHVLHRHTDNKLYVLDVVGNKGAIHFVKTSKSSVEGDTNDGSTYNSLANKFPYGYYPTCVESLGTDLVIGLIEGTNTSIRQKPFALAVWNTTDNTFQTILQEEVPDPLITAIKNVNGTIYVFSGYATGGCRISRLVGNYMLQEVEFIPDSYPPLAGAVDGYLQRYVFGGSVTDPATAGCVWAVGSRYAKLAPIMGLHNIFRATSSGANPMVTCLKYIQQASGGLKPIVGWKDDSGYGIDKVGTSYQTSIFRSELYRVGQPATIKEINIPLVQTVASNMTITPKVYIDDGSSSVTLKTINSTNFANSERNAKLTDFVNCKHNFFLELTCSGTALLAIGLPITIEFEPTKF